jgi:hypothetical protein
MKMQTQPLTKPFFGIQPQWLLSSALILGMAIGFIGMVGCKKADQAAPQYTCSMHPEVVSAQPGKCPKCNMDLIEKR